MAQQTATVKDYYPQMNYIGKWDKTQTTVINFYVIPFKIWQNGDSVEIAEEIFKTAMNVWNGESANTGITIAFAGFADPGDKINETTSKNLFGFGNVLVLDTNEYGRAQTMEEDLSFDENDTRPSQKRVAYSSIKTVHVELSLQKWNIGELVKVTPVANPDARNVYAVAVHELGHALGLADNVAGPTSIMSWNWVHNKDAYDFTLPDKDKFFLRTLYHNNNRPTSTCLPR